jgi:uncharacterized protein (TIGR00645 family)
MLKRLEDIIERTLYASRWLLAPLYLGISLVLLALIVKFFQGVVELWSHLLAASEAEVVLHALSAIDMVLVGSLLVMVMLSGYENFVSRLDVAIGQTELEWLGKLDASALKIKLAIAIVAISSIHLLQAFMDVEKIENDKLMWLVIIHMTFVFSALLLGFLNQIAFSHAHTEQPTAEKATDTHP